MAAIIVCFACFSLGAGAAQAGNDEHSDNGKFLLVSFEENVMFNNNTGTGTLDGKARP